MPSHPAAELTAADTRTSRIDLFGGPTVVIDGERVEVPEGSKRLLALICLSHEPLERRRVAGTLWPFGEDVRAAGNLRSALWRLKGSGIDVIEADKVSLWLQPGVAVDVDLLGDWAARLVAGQPAPGDLDLCRWRAEYLDLFPGWYDDWALFEREHQRQVLLHALEALSRLLSSHGRGGEAVTVATSAVAAEPLRETAQAALIEAHLREGNLCEARRAYRIFRDLARRELGVDPSPSLQALVERPADGILPAQPALAG